MSLDQHLERKANAHVCDCEGCEPMCEDCRNNFCEKCGEQLRKVCGGLLRCSVCNHKQEEM